MSALLLLLALAQGCASQAAGDIVRVAVEALAVAGNPHARGDPPRPPPSSDPKRPPHR
jgi:hypothetical protein